MLSPRSQLSSDFERFGRALPAEWATHVRERYRIDLGARYLGQALPHPVGKGAGQLSLNAAQLEQDRDAGLAFVVLKTVIGERPDGSRRMAAWATPESRMRVEQRAEADGRTGWTVTWKGRGWAGTLADYATLVRAGRDIARAGGPLIVPSAKLHLPLAGEEFDRDEYGHTLRVLAGAWGNGPLLLEKDFSPTLAGDARADDRATILRWIREVPDVVRSCAGSEIVLAMKLMNARFDAGFQQAMLSAAAGADTVTVFNRLWDEEQQVAYGGWTLSDRNLAVLETAGPGGPERSGTGNICSGRQVVEYARRGCTSVQLHTFFQLPHAAYPATHGSRTARALHALVFHPVDGLIACLLDLEEHDLLARHDGELRFLDLAAA
jgi:hypothetical protein